jgi:hypothetical protein
MHAGIAWGKKTAGKRPLGKPQQYGRILKQLLKAWIGGCELGSSPQDWDQWQVLTNMIMHSWVPKNEFIVAEILVAPQGLCATEF